MGLLGARPLILTTARIPPLPPRPPILLSQTSLVETLRAHQGKGVISLPPLPASSESATSGGFKRWRFCNGRRLYTCSNLPSSAYLSAPSFPSMETWNGTQKNLYCLDESLAKPSICTR